jgi:hypothetical protein
VGVVVELLARASQAEITDRRHHQQQREDGEEAEIDTGSDLEARVQVGQGGHCGVLFVDLVFRVRSGAMNLEACLDAVAHRRTE